MSVESFLTNAICYKRASNFEEYLRIVGASNEIAGRRKKEGGGYHTYYYNYCS